ncbi:MAG TPA: glycosyltransferase family 4 protein, partial [Urbifossiella sp.]|nr:glycosyltransferase family 4 protein [Urbifossiella sp.]
GVIVPASVSPLSRLAARPARLLRAARRRVKLALAGESRHHFFDLDDAGLVNHALAAGGHPRLDAAPRVVARRDGDAARGELLYELRDDLRRTLPLALTPAQRGAFLDWFCRFGWDAVETRPVDLLQYLFELDATTDRGLVASYLVQPDWQTACPDALTPSGWDPFKRWVAATFGAQGRWLRRAALPRNLPPRGVTGVNLIGFFRYVSGLQQAGLGVADAFAAAGVPVSLRDVPTRNNRDGRRRTEFLGLEPYPVTVLNTGLDMPVPEAYGLAGLHRRAGVYRVAVWWWELEEVPAEWRDRGRDVDEVWAPTRFIADALRTLGKPVYPMLPAVRLPAFEPLPKSYFGLAPDRFTFLFVFDMNSRLPRKNPVALIRAFRQAFSSDEPVELAVKVSPQGAFYPEWWRELRTAAREAGATLIDRNLSRSELLALMNAADAYASLHRSEGFGLTMAEAMLLGKPTVATGYSGNLDFMTPETSYLVDFTRTTIEDDTPPYPKGCVWAEPSVGHAAALLRRVYDHPDEARAKGARARAELLRLLSPEAAGARMKARLDAIRAAHPEAA